MEFTQALLSFTLMQLFVEVSTQSVIHNMAKFTFSNDSFSSFLSGSNLVQQFLKPSQHMTERLFVAETFFMK